MSKIWPKTAFLTVFLRFFGHFGGYVTKFASKNAKKRHFTPTPINFWQSTVRGGGLEKCRVLSVRGALGWPNSRMSVNGPIKV